MRSLVFLVLSSTIFVSCCTFSFCVMALLAASSCIFDRSRALMAANIDALDCTSKALALSFEAFTRP